MDATLPIIDLDLFRSNDHSSQHVISECQNAANALIAYGALIVKDSRVAEGDNDRFLDLIEDYFAQPTEILSKDERPGLGYQVGVTLENTEKPKCASDDSCLAVIDRLEPSERPLDITGHHPDPKCRFFWKMNTEKPPYPTEYPQLNAPNVVPDAFKDVWQSTLEKWGQMMKNAVEGVAQMTAIGLGLSETTFSDAGRYGPHLLAPTASDLVKYGQKDTILAGFHTDLNFLTIHGRSRYPGLHVWARNTGKRIAVKLPPPTQGNFLLVQAGKQLEHLSGGAIRAGYHEVVVNQSTIETIAARRVSAPERPFIRISSTFFWHLSSDYDLKPISSLETLALEVHKKNVSQGLESQVDVPARYSPMKVGKQVQNELRHIALMA